jgi:hypothetical protein
MTATGSCCNSTVDAANSTTLQVGRGCLAQTDELPVALFDHSRQKRCSGKPSHWQSSKGDAVNEVYSCVFVSA